MKITCCPHYPISQEFVKCKATEFKLSHSQKKVLKKMRSFLISGKRPGDSKNEGSGTHSDSDIVLEIPLKDVKPREKQPDLVIEKQSTEKIPQKKVKLVPAEQKAVKPGATVSSKAKSRTPEKSLEDFVGECLQPNAVHHLQTTLIRSSQLSEEFVQDLEEEHTLYVKYQVAIHNDKPEKCTLQQFTKFLVNSPLNEWIPADGPPKGYGSFHQQYRIDGKLIAVAVLDILPHCVSSVYFFYDPEYSFLSLGTYSSLREIGLVRELSTKCPELCWYYLGYYIHTCPKMRYKRQYNPSYLACPETYRWVCLPDCLPRLEQSKYSRLDPDDKSVDENLVQDLGEVFIRY
nr:EOG090X06AF [Eulimnadia texana]